MKLYKLKYIFYSLLIYLIFSINTTATGYEAVEGKVVVVVVDGLEWRDVNENRLKNLNNIIQEGSIGLLNPISGGSRTRNNVILTMVTGRPVVAQPSDHLILHKNEIFHNLTAAEFFYYATGNDSDGELFHLGYREIQQNNADSFKFGDILLDYQLNATIIGNADMGGEINRTLANVVISSRGYHHSGIVQQEELLKAERQPILQQTDFNLLHSNLIKSWDNNQIIFIEIADLLRVEEKRKWLLPHISTGKKQAFLYELDILLGDLITRLDRQNDLLIVFNPAPTSKQIAEKDFMRPIIMWGKNFDSRLLSSSTTKREGIVVNYDVLPTILNHFYIEDRVGIGGVITSNGASGVDKLMVLNDRLLVVFHQRPLIIKTYIFLQILIVTLTLLSIIFNLPYKKNISLGLLLLTIIPFSLLITAFFNNSLLNIVVTNFVVIGFLLMTSWYFETRKRLTGFLMVFTITSITILFDLANNSFLMKQSILGYDPIAGARYYGLGNEYMGVFIGASLMTVALISQMLTGNKLKLFRRSLVIISILIISFIGLPNLGTNVGGTIAAIFGFSYLIFKLTIKQAKIYKIIISASGAVLIILSVFVLFDINRAIETQSHLGRTALLVRQEGFTHLIEIAIGKINMNIKLIKYTNWSRVFLVVLGGLALLFYKPPGLLAQKLSENPGLKTGVFSVTIASLVALVVNDSGIVAAATMMIYGAIPLFFLLLDG